MKEYYLLICNRGSYFRLIQSWTFIHKLIVHSASLYFSFRTRKIKISVLNEYKSSSAIAYSTIIFVFLTAVLLFPLAGYPNIYVFCYTLLLFTMVSLFVSLTFIPKVYIYICCISEMYNYIMKCIVITDDSIMQRSKRREDISTRQSRSCSTTGTGNRKLFIKNRSNL